MQSRSKQEWTEEEHIFLKSSYGVRPTVEIATKLRRGVRAVESEAYKLALISVASTGSRVVKQCVETGCTRRKGSYCLGWTDPSFMWLGRTCPHLSKDPELHESILNDILSYKDKKLERKDVI